MIFTVELDNDICNNKNPHITIACDGKTKPQHSNIVLERNDLSTIPLNVKLTGNILFYN